MIKDTKLLIINKTRGSNLPKSVLIFLENNLEQICSGSKYEPLKEKFMESLLSKFISLSH